MKEWIRNWLKIECDCGQPVKQIREYKGKTTVFMKKVPLTREEERTKALEIDL